MSNYSYTKYDAYVGRSLITPEIKLGTIILNHINTQPNIINNFTYDDNNIIPNPSTALYSGNILDYDVKDNSTILQHISGENFPHTLVNNVVLLIDNNYYIVKEQLSNNIKIYGKTHTFTNKQFTFLYKNIVTEYVRILELNGTSLTNNGNNPLPIVLPIITNINELLVVNRTYGNHNGIVVICNSDNLINYSKKYINIPSRTINSSTISVNLLSNGDDSWYII